MTVNILITPVLPPAAGELFPLGDGPAVLTSAGGWQTVSRPRRTALTEWQGQDPTSMKVPILLDGFLTDTPIEARLSVLFGWLRVASGPGQTPVLRVEGPVPLTGQMWVLNTITWGEEVRRESDGQRVRQALELEFMEYVPADILIQVGSSPAAAATNRAVAVTSSAISSASTTSTTTPPPSGATYTVKRGDTLALIAQRQLGASTKWSQIADLNGIRDPRNIKVGQVLKLPASTAPAPRTTAPGAAGASTIDRIRPGGLS